jgi:amino acid adenylation domain-containing protein
VTRADAYPMTSLQAGMVFHSEFEAASSVYHSLLTLTVAGPYHAEAMAAALGEVTAAYPALRTRFGLTEPGSLHQVIEPAASVPLTVADLSGLDRRQAADRLREWQRQERYQRFDPAKAPLLRVFAHRMRRGGFRLTLSYHHAILDRRSAALLARDLLRRYAARAGSAPAPDPGGGGDAGHPAAAARAYREAAATEQSLAASPEVAGFWREWLAGPATVLPRMPGYPLAGETGCATVRLGVEPEVVAGVTATARRLGVPLGTVLLAAHLRALGAATGAAHASTGVLTTIAADPQVPGMFLNAVPVRAGLGHGTWDDLIGEVAAAQAAVAPYHSYPLAEIAQVTGRSPVLETLLCHHQEEVGGDLTEETSFPLEAAFHGPGGDGPLALALTYQRSQFPQSQISRIGDYHLRALAQIAQGAAGPRQTATYLGADIDLIEKWNDTGRDYPSGTLAGMLASQAAASPGRQAVWADGAWLTYQEFAGQVYRLAHHLAARGVRPGDVVGICLERSAQLVVAVHAAVAAGAAYLPLEPDYPRQRLAYMAGDAGTRVVITRSALSGRLADVLRPGAAGHDQPAAVLIDAEAPQIAARPAQPPDVPIPPDALAYVIYTSGSTGRPKGVGVSHRAILNRLRWMQETLPLTPSDRAVLKTPFSFDVSLPELFSPLLYGASLVVAAPGGHVDASYMITLVETQRVTTAHWVPAMLEALLREPGLASRLATLRRVYCSGEALPPAVAERFHAALPGVELHNLYGPTEAAVEVTWHRCQPGADLIPIGAPVANTRIRILDPFGQQTPIGVPGELCIAGSQVARGYLGRPELTAEKFVPDPFGPPGSRMYRTGDLARWLPEGEIEYLGRIDHQVQLRGLRIELGEIEAELAAVPGVRAAVAAVIEGDDGPRLTAFTVPADPESPVPGVRLRRHLAAILPPSMVPASYVTLGQLPLTPNGKVDRKALPAYVTARQDEPVSSDAGYRAPASDTEAWLESVWQEMLGPHVAGTSGDFFALGGGSLLALCLAARAKERYGIRLPLAVLYRSPTIGQLAAWLERDMAAP